MLDEFPDTTPREEVAWAAGLFEGEGSFFTTKHPRGRVPYVGMQLQMVDRDTVERFHRIVGYGAVTAWQPSQESRQRVYCWRVQSVRAVVDLIPKFWPWLGERRRARAASLLAVAKDVLPNGRGHCAKGHPYTEANTRFWVRPEGTTKRICKTCERERDHARSRARSALRRR